MPYVVALLLALPTWSQAPELGKPAASDEVSRSEPEPAGAESSSVEEIEITAPKSAQAASAETWTSVPASRIRRSDARSVSEVLERAPGALVQTNSRGETLVFLRNAGDRQVSVFFDGAPLEVPWDHRLDLKLFPAASIGRVEVARGPLSNRYGPNISGGAVFLAPRDAPAKQSGQFQVEAGTAGHLRVSSSVAASPSDRASFMVAGEHTEADGQPLVEDLAFSQASSDLRTNTDARRTSALAHGALRLTDVDITATAFYGRAELGVAPESHLDPTVDPVRYWRYPNSELAMVVGGLRTSGDRGALDAVLWWQAFDQTIERFTSARYETRAERQRDTNRSLGARLRLLGQFGSHRLSASTYGSLSSHDERRAAGLDTASPTVEADTFLHGLWSGGVDYEGAWGPVRIRLGGGVDGLEPIETAGRPSAGGFRAWNATGGVRFELSRVLSVHAALGSRARLPTPRELFGTALDRFVLNENLDSERNTTFEAGLRYAHGPGSIQIVPFGTWTGDTLAQESVEVDGAVFRRRVNLDGSRVLGVEVIADLRLMAWLRCAGQLLVSDVRRFGGGERRLAERPNVQAFGEVVVGFPTGFEFVTEFWARSAAYSLAPEGLRSVPGAALVNFRGSYRLASASWGAAEAYVRLSNAFNARLEPQLGLPEPGRQVRAGMALDF